MLSGFTELISALIFPLECESCGSALPARPPVGICRKCYSEIRILGAPHCPGCGRTLTGGSAKCGSCLGQNFHFDRAFACTRYDGKIKELLHAYKFGGRKYLKNLFAKIIFQFMGDHLSADRFDAVAAVPLSPARKRERGFNQSELISKEVAKKTGAAHVSRALIRIKSAAPQSLLSKNERRANVRGCFLAKERGPFQAKRVLLVDDILTTGNTASECARTLKKAGAASVTVLACARGD